MKKPLLVRKIDKLEPIHIGGIELVIRDAKRWPGKRLVYIYAEPGEVAAVEQLTGDRAKGLTIHIRRTVEDRQASLPQHQQKPPQSHQVPQQRVLSR